MPKDSQHVPLEQYTENLRAIVTHPYVRAHDPTVLLVTPPPLDEIRIAVVDRQNCQPHQSRHSQISASYSEAARRVAHETPGVVLVDLWKAVMDVAITKTPGFDASSGGLLGSHQSGQRGHLERLLPDGLHLSGESYKIFFDALVPHIKPRHPALTTEGYVLPEWRVAPWLG